MKKLFGTILCIILASAIILACGSCYITSCKLDVQDNSVTNGSVSELNTTPVLIGEDFCFSFSLSDFIEKYNAVYFEDNGDNYLRSELQWTMFVNENSPFSERVSRYYRFNYDESILTFPTISVYMPASKDYVQGITIDFDDHGYSSYQYEVYESQCFYALKVLLPDCEDGTLIKLYTELSDYAYENVKEDGLSVQTVPDVIYCKDNIAVFSYFAIGDYVNLCIIPVTEEIENELNSEGADVRSIDSLK